MGDVFDYIIGANLRWFRSVMYFDMGVHCGL